MHEEPGLDEREGLAEADSRELGDHDGRHVGVLAIVAVYVRGRGCSLRGRCLVLVLGGLNHLLVLN